MLVCLIFAEGGSVECGALLVLRVAKTVVGGSLDLNTRIEWLLVAHGQNRLALTAIDQLRGAALVQALILRNFFNHGVSREFSFRIISSLSVGE